MNELGEEFGNGDHRLAEWEAYWASLTPAQQAAELRMMDEHDAFTADDPERAA